MKREAKIQSYRERDLPIPDSLQARSTSEHELSASSDRTTMQLNRAGTRQRKPTHKGARDTICVKCRATVASNGHALDTNGKSKMSRKDSMQVRRALQ